MPQSPPDFTMSLGGMTFDAWLSCDQDSELTITSSPVEYGAAVSDHSFVNPMTFAYIIGVSNCNVNPVQPGLSSKRNINAYNRLREAQASRTPMRLISKYGSYDNVLIRGLSVHDDYRTQETLFANVRLEQIIIVNTLNYQVTSNPQATNITNRGQVSARPVRPDRVAQAQEDLNFDD